MKAKNVLLLLVLLGMCSCASAGTQQSSNKIGKAVIVERSIIPPYSGYLRTYILFKLKVDDSNLEVLYPHFEDGKRIPEVGEACALSYHVESVDGQVGDKSVKAANVKVIDSLACEIR